MGGCVTISLLQSPYDPGDLHDPSDLNDPDDRRAPAESVRVLLEPAACSQDVQGIILGTL